MKICQNIMQNYLFMFIFNAHLLYTGAVSINETDNTNIDEALFSFIYDSYVIVDNVELSEADYIQNVTINKCQCANNEAFFNGKCVQNYTTYYPIFTPDVYIVQESLISLKSYNLKCSDGFMMAEFTPAHFGIFYTSGIFSVQIPFIDYIVPDDQYCMQSSLNSTQHLMLTAKICLPIPKLRRCCSTGQIFDEHSSKTCVSNSESSKSPPVSVYAGDLEIADDIYDNLPHKALSCSSNESLVRRHTNYNHYLSFHSGALEFNTFYYRLEDYFSISSDKFCLDTTSGKSLEVVYCYDDPLVKQKKLCRDEHCLRKCCPADLTSTMDDYVSCNHPHPTNWTAEETESSIWVYGFPYCKERLIVLDPQEDSDNTFVLAENGQLDLPRRNASVLPHAYCMDDFLDETSTARRVVYACFTKEEESLCWTIKTSIYQTLFVVSSVFLTIALLIYIAVPKLQQQVYDKSLAFHAASLLVGFIILIVKEWASQYISKNSCIVLGLFLQFSFLCCMFWLNILCVDIVFTLLSCNTDLKKDQRRSRFIKYNLYGWGAPVIICSITAALQTLPYSLTKDLIHPGFGVNGCWFKNSASSWAYFNGIVLLLTTCNIIMFLIYFFHAVVFCHNSILRNNCEIKERVLLNVKLVTLMGLTWICEVLHGQDDVVCVDNYFTLWLLPDIINALRGLFIFILLMTKNDVQQRIKQYLKPSVDLMKDILLVSRSSTKQSRSNNSNSIPSARRDTKF